jgi:hypothetical protein
MKPDTFDGLTKLLATPISRRRAFRRIGGILAGGSLAGVAALDLSPGVALADTTYDCLYFCASLFPAGANRNQCLSDAKTGTGLCYSLGPKSPGGSTSICCPSDANGQCTSYTQTSSCGSGQTCQSGTCVSTCSGTTLLNGTCAQPCSGGCSCGFCASDLALNSYCTTAQGSLTLCVTDLTCPKGEFCNNILGVGVCQNAVVC